MRKKCNFLNPDSYEFLIWFFLGVALTVVFWLIIFVVPISKEYAEILKDGIGAITTIVVAIPSVILILCQMQQQEEVQKETNTLQLIDSLLYDRFQKILNEIKLAEEENMRKIAELSSQTSTEQLFDNSGTPDAEPNEKYFEYEDKRYKIDNETQQHIHDLINNFFDFIYDVEIKIEHNLINEELTKLYFRDPIQSIFVKKFIIGVLKVGSGYQIADDYSSEKKNKIKVLSQRWYKEDFFELDKVETR